MFAVLAVTILVLGARSKLREGQAARAPVPLPPPYAPPPPPPPSGRRELARLRELDPAFSPILFEDFLVVLYAEIKTALGAGTLARYAPYLSEAARAALARPEGAISTVLVGGLTIESVSGLEAAASHVRVVVGFEANYTEGERGVYVRESWTLERRRDARSRPPARARVVDCPSCGAPLDVVVAGVCGHCKSDVAAGQRDWGIVSVVVHETSARGPLLTSDVEERGTDLATIVAPGAADRLAKMSAADSAASWDAISARVHAVFAEFHAGWSARDLPRMRPLMTDALFAVQSFWVQEYLRQGLRNVTEGAAISKLELCEVSEDACYDAVTVRVHASCVDVTLADATGAVVSGDRAKTRRYTEYWTLIRGRGDAPPSAAPPAEKECPRCGAPLELEMGGNCKYCKAKVTSARFDWILSRIEQDEVYRG